MTISTSTPLPNDQRYPVGIDLGTTYSVAAFLEDTGRPRTITNDVGDLLTPSAVLVEDGEIIVGKETLKSSTITPDSFADCFKRDMGEPAFRRGFCGITIPPAVLSAFVLEKLKRDAETRLGPVRDVVVTVPAFFDENRRRSTQEAARLAGLNVLDIINEPTAAAVAYAFEKGVMGGKVDATRKTPERILVYDLGGGTFDVSILEIEGNRFRTLATDGDVQLGGKDFDLRIVNHVAEYFLNKHGLDPRSDLRDAAQLWLDAREAKHVLSQRQRIPLVCFHGGIREKIELTRELFDELTQDLIDRTITTTSLTVRSAGLKWEDIDRILLVGGSSRMPMVVAALRAATGKEPDRSQSPDEAIAHGAAIYAGMLSADKTKAPVAQFELVNVNSHSLGVVGMHAKTRQKSNVILIPKNTPLPAKAVRTFRTAKADQRDVKVQVVEGESHRPEHCIPLGHCVVRNLPPGLPQGTRIDVEYRYASNGRISVAARVPASRQSAVVEIQRNTGVELGDLQTWKARLQGVESATEPTPGEPSTMGETRVPRKLAQLFQKIGSAAVQQEVPRKVRGSRDAARGALERLFAAQARLLSLQENTGGAVSSTESLQHGAELANAKMDTVETRKQVDLLLLALGRDCLTARYHPLGVESEIAEAQQLQSSATA